MKRILCCISLVLCVILCSACEDKKEVSIAGNLMETFEKEVKNEKDINKLADKIKEDKVITIMTATEEKENTDFLTGFDEAITNFKKAVVIQPMIGSIPFICYVFESEDAKALKEELEKKANKSWNICTQADEMKIKVVDNYVFFVMAPNTFEE